MISDSKTWKIYSETLRSFHYDALHTALHNLCNIDHVYMSVLLFYFIFLLFDFLFFSWSYIKIYDPFLLFLCWEKYSVSYKSPVILFNSNKKELSSFWKRKLFMMEKKTNSSRAIETLHDWRLTTRYDEYKRCYYLI